MIPTWQAYDLQAPERVAEYESLPFETVHAPILPWLPGTPGRVLDVGAGSGRDAAWFAERGHQVVAAEPSEAMRALARERHPHPSIRWCPDALPELADLTRRGCPFELILLGGVWMHVAPGHRERAFRHLVALLAPGGRLIIGLRHGPPPPGRIFHPVSRTELEALATHHGLTTLLKVRSGDDLGRPGVSWTNLVFQRGQALLHQVELRLAGHEGHPARV